MNPVDRRSRGSAGLYPGTHKRTLTIVKIYYRILTRKAIIRCALSVVLTAYLIFALGMSHDMAALDVSPEVEINVLDTGSHHGKNFVTVDGISSEIGDLPLIRRFFRRLTYAGSSVGLMKSSI